MQLINIDGETKLERVLKALRRNFWRMFLLALVLLFSAIVGLMFSLWQLDMICVNPVWNEGWCHPVGRYADDYFQCGPWKTTIGEAYDTLLALSVTALLLAVVSTFLLGLLASATWGRKLKEGE